MGSITKIEPIFFIYTIMKITNNENLKESIDSKLRTAKYARYARILTQVESDQLYEGENSEGINVKNIEPRLILTTNENKNYLFIGKMEEDICKFSIPELKSYKKGDNGRMKFEIISEDLYFPVWEDNFEINTKATIQLESVVNDVKEEVKPKITATVNVQPVIEKNVPKIDTNKQEKKLADKDLDEEYEDFEDKDKKKDKKDEVKEQVKNFSDFLK